MATKDSEERLPGEGKPPADQPAESSLKEADKVPGPFTGDADLHDPPVRSNRPESELVETLAVGAGRHEPPDDDEFDADGRYIGPAEGRPALKQSDTRSTATSKRAAEKETR